MNYIILHIWQQIDCVFESDFMRKIFMYIFLGNPVNIQLNCQSLNLNIRKMPMSTCVCNTFEIPLNFIWWWKLQYLFIIVEHTNIILVVSQIDKISSLYRLVFSVNKIGRNRNRKCFNTYDYQIFYAKFSLHWREWPISIPQNDELIQTFYMKVYIICMTSVWGKKPPNRNLQTQSPEQIIQTRAKELYSELPRFNDFLNVMCLYIWPEYTYIYLYGYMKPHFQILYTK